MTSTQLDSFRKPGKRGRTNKKREKAKNTHPLKPDFVLKVDLNKALSSRRQLWDKLKTQDKNLRVQNIKSKDYMNLIVVPDGETATNLVKTIPDIYAREVKKPRLIIYDVAENGKKMKCFQV